MHKLTHALQKFYNYGIILGYVTEMTITKAQTFSTVNVAFMEKLVSRWQSSIYRKVLSRKILDKRASDFWDIS